MNGVQTCALPIYEYAHFLQKYGKLPDPEDIDENEDIADKFSHKVVKEFIATE